VATLLDETIITDTLGSLPGWQGDGSRLWRDVHLDAGQDGELRRQIAVDAEAMGHAPTFEEGEGGATRLVLTTAEQGGVTELDIMMASHISDLVHRIENSEPGVAAERDGDVVAIIRPGESATGEDLDQDPELPRTTTAMLES
jgi:4a-hydroxytetrahydrobiopterin dehydratase